jgi:hypothetical protein
MTDTTITVQYQIHADDQHSRGEIQLPGWAAGDPQMAVALYFFGERTSVELRHQGRDRSRVGVRHLRQRQQQQGRWPRARQGR